MIEDEITLYKELVDFCNAHQDEIEQKFKQPLEFTSFNEVCYKSMYYECRNISAPISVQELKEKIPGLKEAYSINAPKYLNPRNRYNKGMDIQKGNWYEKGLQLFLATKGLEITKKGFPFPDFEVHYKGSIVGYFELKYIEAPFINASRLIRNTYPYKTTRYDYEASLTLDSGRKMKEQREKIENDIIPQHIPVHYLWWYDSFHIKGLFAMDAQQVFDYQDGLGGDVWERAKRDGDFVSKQVQTKIYPPLLNMIPFSEYLTLLKK